jgi:hypothetical protein
LIIDVHLTALLVSCSQIKIMAEDKNLSATPKLYHISNSGRGRGPRGPRSQTFTDTPGRSNNNYQHSRQGRGAGRGNVNHGRQPRQQANSSHQTRNNQRQRPRSHSHHDKEFKKIIDGPYAHLFCSERHGFALSRVLYPIEETSLSSCYKDGSTPKITSAQLEKWWESVKLVRCHIPYDETSSMQSILDRCPICLDEEMMAPHVAPCGHTFCLPCVLGYLNSVAKDLNAEAERICKTKQRVPEGKAIIIGSATKTSVAVTTVRARCPMCSSGNSAELTAGDSMVTYRELRPVVCVPVTVVKAKAVSGSLKHQGSRMKFVKLHRALDCPSPYLPLEGHKVRCGSAGASSSPTQRLLPDYPDGDDHEEECMYSRQYYVGCNEYDNVLKRSLDDLLKYSRKSGYCQVDAREKWNVSMAIEAVQASLRRWVGCGGADGGFRSMELEAKVNFTTCASLVELVITQRNVDAIDEIHANPALIEPGTVHLNPDMSECIYYQASDGQMCFLSGINMACLTYEFSLHATEQSEAPPSRNTMPLPDSIEGIVLAAESTIVTPELVKRKHFLSHLPLGFSVRDMWLPVSTSKLLLLIWDAGNRWSLQKLIGTAEATVVTNRCYPKLLLISFVPKYSAANLID